MGICAALVWGATWAGTLWSQEAQEAKEVKEAKDKPAAPASKQVEITADKSAEFDAQGRIATFEGNIKLVDPQFTLTSDTLKVEMLKEGGIKRAEAIGNVVIITQQASKRTEDEPPTKSRAKSKRAIYEPTSGDVTLIGLPQIQQGINLHIATSEDTRMVLNRAGGMKTFGPSKTVLQEAEAVK